MKSALLLRSALGALILCPSAAWAQNATPATDDTASQQIPGAAPTDQPDQLTQTGEVGDIIVTAQRRSESLQKVPLSVTAIGADKLTQTQATSTDDLPALVPGLTLARAGGQSIFIRGLGNGGTVLRYIDGILAVYTPGTYQFQNLDSVEVDKGPQSTLFGRNATGGVVQFHTKDPSYTTGGDISLGYANYNTLTGAGYLTSGLTDKVAADISVNYQNQADGWGTNFATGEDQFTQKSFDVRARLLADITETLKAILSFEYTYTRTNVGALVGPSDVDPFLYNSLTNTRFTVPGRYNTDLDFPSFLAGKVYIGGLRLEKDLGGIRALSITSYQGNRQHLSIDYDGTPIPFIDLDRKDQNRAVTQEFQLLSDPASRISWVLGAFYLHTHNNMNPFQFGGPSGQVVFGAPAGEAFNIHAVSVSNSYAAFGQATVPVTSSTKITAGARYTIDHVSINGYTAYNDTPIPGSQGGASTTFRRPTWKVDVQQQVTKDAFTYASYTRGYNTGGFNNVLPQGFTNVKASLVNPESVDAYEVGAKTQWFENHLRFNVAGFHYNYKNLQIPSFAATGGLEVLNAAAAHITGVDVDFEVKPLSHLSLNGGFEYLDAKYASYPNAPIYTFALNGALVTGVGDAKGKRLINAPKFGWNLQASYDLPTAFGVFTTSGNATYSDRYALDSYNNFFSLPRHIVNLSERWVANDKRMSATLFVKNVGNKFYDQGINLLTPIGLSGQPGAPRTYGFIITRHF